MQLLKKIIDFGTILVCIKRYKINSSIVVVFIVIRLSVVKQAAFYFILNLMR